MTSTGPHLILSASGMASGGRVLHHLHNNIGDPKATIIFPGYQSLGTLGYILTHGAKTVTALQRHDPDSRNARAPLGFQRPRRSQRTAPLVADLHDHAASVRRAR